MSNNHFPLAMRVIVIPHFTGMRLEPPMVRYLASNARGTGFQIMCGTNDEPRKRLAANVSAAFLRAPLVTCQELDDEDGHEAIMSRIAKIAEADEIPIVVCSAYLAKQLPRLIFEMADQRTRPELIEGFGLRERDFISILPFYGSVEVMNMADPDRWSR